MKIKNLSVPYYITIPAIVILINVISIFFMDQSEHMATKRWWSIAFALVAIWETAIAVSFWQHFPRRESHFTITLALFLIFALLMFSPGKYLSHYFDSMIPLVLEGTLITIISLSIVISLWAHKLRKTAYWALALWILVVIGAFDAVTTFHNARFGAVTKIMMIRS